MAQSAITHVRYVAHATPAFSEALTFYSGPFGLEVVESSETVAYLTSQGSKEAFELRLRRADEKHLDLVSLAVADRQAVDQLASRLSRAGVRMDSEPQELASPGGGYGFRFFDIDGRLIELSSDVAQRNARDLAEGETVPLKLSHVVLNSPDPEATCKFYQDHLGYGLRERITDFLYFLYCGVDHHNIAIVRAPHVSFHHMAFEMRGLNEFLLANGRMARLGFSPVFGPGRHGPGNNTFDYFVDPAGNVVEYTYGLLQISDPAEYPFRVAGWEAEEVDQWGLVGPFEEYANASRGVPDPQIGFSSPI